LTSTKRDARVLISSRVNLEGDTEKYQNFSSNPSKESLLAFCRPGYFFERMPMFF